MSDEQDIDEVTALHAALLHAWNQRSATDYAALFSEGAHLVGFDGSQMDGPGEVASQLGAIFADHPTATYVGDVRGCRLLAPGVALLTAVVGMVPPGAKDISPAVNAIQSLVAARQGSAWRIELLQNTPAAFHGRPEVSEQLTNELRAVLQAKGVA